MNTSEQELLKKGRTLALKVFAEAFLVSKGNKKTKELFPDKRITNQTQISDEEAYVLHNWLMDEYRSMGLNLQKLVEATGEKIEENKLSKYELKELIRRADIMLVQLNVFKDYLKANKKSEII